MSSEIPTSTYVQVQHATAHFHQGYYDADFDVNYDYKSIDEIDGDENEDELSLLGLAQERYLEELVTQVPIKKGDVVLDVGCGTGATAVWLAKRFGCSVYGIDIVVENIVVAKERIKNEQLGDLIQVEAFDAFRMELLDRKFTHVIGVEALYHLEDKQTLFTKIHDVLHDAGYLIFSDYMLERPCSSLLAESAKEVVESKHLVGLNDYHKVLASAGFERIDERDVSVNTIKKLVESEKKTKFMYVKSTAGGNRFIHLLIDVFGPVVANSLEKGIQEGKFKINFMTYKKPN